MGTISIDTEGLASVMKILNQVVGRSVGALPDVISTANKLVNEYGPSLETINQIFNTSDNETMSQILSGLGDVINTVGTLISGMDSVVNNFEDAEHSNTSTVTNLGGEIFSGLLNSGLSIIPGITQGGLTNLGGSGLTNAITSLLNNALTGIISNPKTMEIVSGLLTNLGIGLTDLISKITGVEDAQAEENVKAIVAELIKMMDAIEIQEGLTAMVGLINAELFGEIAKVIGVGVTDVINIGTKIGTKTLTVRDVTNTLAHFIDGTATVINTPAVQNVVNYIDGKVLTLDNAILGLNAIITILNAYSTNEAVGKVAEELQITQEIAQAASVLLQVGINVLQQPGVANLINIVDNNVITMKNASTILTGVSNLLQVNSPMGAFAVIMGVYKDVISSVSVNEIVASMVNAYTGLIIKGDYTDGNIANLLNQSDVLKPIMDVYAEKIADVNLDSVLQGLLDSIEVQGLTGEMVVNFVGGLLNAAVALSTNKTILGLITKINYDALLKGDIVSLLTGSAGLVEKLAGSGSLEEILNNQELKTETLNSVTGLLGSVAQSLGGEESLKGLLSVITNDIAPVATEYVGTAVSVIGSMLGLEVDSTVINNVLSSEVITGLLGAASSVDVSQLLGGALGSGDIGGMSIGNLLTTTEGIEKLVTTVTPLITVSTKEVFNIISSILSSYGTGNNTAVENV